MVGYKANIINSYGNTSQPFNPSFIASRGSLLSGALISKIESLKPSIFHCGTAICPFKFDPVFHAADFL